MENMTQTKDRSDNDNLDRPVTSTQLADAPTTDEERRERLRERIEASQERHEQRTIGDTIKEAGETVTDFAKKHPLATVAGVLGLGLLVGSMTRPGRRAARRGGMFARLAVDTVAMYGMSAIDKATTGAAAARRSGGDAFEDFGDSIGSTLRGLRRDAAYRSDVIGDTVRSGSRKASRKASRAARDLKFRAGR